MDKIMALSSNYVEEIKLSQKKSTCDVCYDRGYFVIFNAYEPQKETIKHCECLLGRLFLDNQLKALNSTQD